MKRQKNEMDCDSYENIYQKYADDVYRVSLYLTKQPRIAQDITKQAFENLYKELDEVEEKYIFSYLVQKVKSYAKEAIQQQSTEEEVGE